MLYKVSKGPLRFLKIWFTLHGGSLKRLYFFRHIVISLLYSDYFTFPLSRWSVAMINPPVAMLATTSRRSFNLGRQQQFDPRDIFGPVLSGAKALLRIVFLR